MVRRVEVHDQYGGGRQGGISPSRSTPNVLVFSDPDVGVQHGYHDRWEGPEYHYVGEGQRGNQTMTRGNAAILNHRLEGRSLRLFWGVRRTVQYAGEFAVADGDAAWYFARANETGSTRQREVITFRLRPLGDVDFPSAEMQTSRRFVRRLQPVLSEGYRWADETVASAARDPFTIDPNAVDRGLIGHAVTQNHLAEMARQCGYSPISPAMGDPNFDLAWFDGEGRCVVVEVKSLTLTNEPQQLRLGLGQILDFAHEIRRSGHPVRPVLAVEREPTEPRWVGVCRDAGVELVWPTTFSTVLVSR